MNPRTGILLRLLGPLIEIACAATLMKTWGQGRTFAGVRLESLLMLGFLVGFSMVVAGLSLVRRTHPTRRPEGRGAGLLSRREDL